MSKWDAASTIVNEIRSHFATINQWYRRYGLAGHYGDLDAIAEALQSQSMPERTMDHLMIGYRDWAPLAFWNERKEVYTMHPRMANELGAATVDETIPASVLQRLPHPNPLFVIPGGIDITHNDGKPGRITAIQVSGAVVPEPGSGQAIITSTTDNRANGLHLTTIAEVLNEGGDTVDWDYCHTSIMTSGNFTIGEVITKDRDYVAVADGGGMAFGMDDAALAYVQQTTGIAIAHLLYVASRNAEIAEPRKTTGAQSRAAQRRGDRAPGSIRHRPVGYVIGAAIDAYDRQGRESQPRSAGTGRTIRPHTRRGHFHTVRYGKGRALSYIDWFPPIPVKVDGPATVPTLHEYGTV